VGAEKLTTRVGTPHLIENANRDSKTRRRLAVC
jgi:hypothetical protein